jgi:hypothetical protein
VVFINRNSQKEEYKISDIKHIKYSKKSNQNNLGKRVETWEINFNNNKNKLITIQTDDDKVCDFFITMFLRYTILVAKNNILLNKFNEATINLKTLIEQYGQDELKHYLSENSLTRKYELINILSKIENNLIKHIKPIPMKLEKLNFKNHHCHSKKVFDKNTEGYSICKRILREDCLVARNNEVNILKIDEICVEDIFQTSIAHDDIINIQAKKHYSFTSPKDIAYITKWLEFKEAKRHLEYYISNNIS